MDDARALHTAARRYCQDRFAEWAGAYEDLQRKENWRVQKLFQPGWDYSDEACRTFPRYRVAKNTQIEIERLVASSDMSLAEMRKCLIAASDKAKTTLQTELTNKLARNAIREEAEDFRVYVETLTPEDLVQVEALPYRRVLKALEQRGVSKLFLLHEFGDPEYEIDLSIFVPGYRDGGEQYSTSTDTDWMVYASHESSITVCGEWMNQLLRKLHPECAERTYKGPYSTPDLRGTWETTR
jgi:hypothetical protein